MRAALMFLGAVVGVSLLGPVGANAQKARGAGPFDGVYAVDVYTQSGACDRVFRWTIQVVGGRVSTHGDGFVQASGLVTDKGAVSLAFRRDSQVANVAGRVRSGAGSGTWSSPTMQCAGSWRAARVS
ncbi:hypothetical protein [Methylocella sp.]|uniref:hypothetical protein n=1 Tax=Methylocella sp. TaxID=1978226 RepID=UPI00378508D5